MLPSVVTHACCAQSSLSLHSKQKAYSRRVVDECLCVCGQSHNIYLGERDESEQPREGAGLGERQAGLSQGGGLVHCCHSKLDTTCASITNPRLMMGGEEKEEVDRKEAGHKIRATFKITFILLDYPRPMVCILLAVWKL